MPEVRRASKKLVTVRSVAEFRAAYYPKPDPPLAYFDEPVLPPRGLLRAALPPPESASVSSSGENTK